MLTHTTRKKEAVILTAKTKMTIIHTAIIEKTAVFTTKRRMTLRDIKEAMEDMVEDLLEELLSV